MLWSDGSSFNEIGNVNTVVRADVVGGVQPKMTTRLSTTSVTFKERTTTQREQFRFDCATTCVCRYTNSNWLCLHPQELI